MKKFLHLDLKKSAPEIPLALDQRILAAAAMHARRVRRGKLLCRIALPTTAVTAAAAATVLFSGVILHKETLEIPAVSTPAVAVTTQKITEPENNMLALYDMTALEQGNYTIALVSDTAWDEDLSSI